jgi:hypothetical protein
LPSPAQAPKMRQTASETIRTKTRTQGTSRLAGQSRLGPTLGTLTREQQTSVSPLATAAHDESWRIARRGSLVADCRAGGAWLVPGDGPSTTSLHPDSPLW